MSAFRRCVLIAALPMLATPPFFVSLALGQDKLDDAFQEMVERSRQAERKSGKVPQAEAPQPMKERLIRQSITASPSSIARCDSFAGHPDDPNRKGAGVPDEDVDLVAALRECTQAASEVKGSDEARIMFQMGRTLWLAEEFEEAMPFLLDAAEAKEPAALAYLGDAYANGVGGANEDLETALAFYTQAAAAGFAPADAMADEVAAELAESSSPKIQIAAKSAQEVNECDRLAAHPADPRKIAPGVADASLDTPKAISACAAASSKFPGVARLDYQYGRALYLDGQIEAALPILAGAAEKGHSAAKALLGDVFLEGRAGQTQDLGAAYTFYKEAAAGGFVPAAAHARELEASLAPTPTSSVAPLRLSCEVLMTRTDQLYNPIEYVNAKFSLSLDFISNTAKLTSETSPGLKDKTVFSFNAAHALEVNDAGSTATIQVNPLGENATDTFMTLQFADGKIYMAQRYQVGSLFGFGLYNSLYFEGYCGEQPTHSKPRSSGKPKKRA